MLIAVDNSQYASVVMERVANLASLIGTDVVVVSVVKMPTLTASEGEIDSKAIDSEEREYEALHRNLIDKYFPQKGIVLESKILHGDPADKICEYAEKVNADLVIVGTRGRGRLTAAVLGSVSGKVVQNCKRSVLIVKKPPFT